MAIIRTNVGFFINFMVRRQEANKFITCTSTGLTQLSSNMKDNVKESSDDKLEIMLPSNMLNMKPGFGISSFFETIPNSLSSKKVLCQEAIKRTIANGCLCGSTNKIMHTYQEIL